MRKHVGLTLITNRLVRPPLLQTDGAGAWNMIPTPTEHGKVIFLSNSTMFLATTSTLGYHSISRSTYLGPPISMPLLSFIAQFAQLQVNATRYPAAWAQTTSLPASGFPVSHDNLHSSSYGSLDANEALLCTASRDEHGESMPNGPGAPYADSSHRFHLNINQR